MKKILFSVIIFLLVVTMVGCSISDKKINGETDNENETIKNIDAIEPDIDQKKDETSDAYHLQFLSALEAYVSSDKVSETLLNAYKGADTVKSVPILGTFLEPTDVVAYMFFNDGEICSTALLSFNTKGDPIDIELTEFAKTNLNDYTVIDAQSKESCYSSVKECLSINPKFEILGIVFNDSGYPATLPIGRCKGETVIKYFLNEPMSFNLVEPFETIEEGRVAFAKYLAEKDAIKAQIPIFSWETANFYETGFWRMYSLDYVYDDTEEYQNMILPNVEAVDSWISIPLLDEELNEGVLISHLLYFRNQLIGEIVIMKKSDSSVVAIYADIAEKSGDGTYISIEKSEYQKAIEKAISFYPNVDIEGVIFRDGKYIPFGYHGDSMILMEE